jgi:hypothetical protein
MKTLRIELSLSIGRGSMRAGLMLLLLVAVPLGLGSESFEMTTTYPAPAGIYQNLTATRGADLARDSGDVIMARGGGRVAIGSPSAGTAKLAVLGGNVGLQTTTPKMQAPDGGTTGNLDANDVFIRATNKWVSEMGFNGNITTRASGQQSNDSTVALGEHKFCSLSGVKPIGPVPNCGCDVRPVGGNWQLIVDVREGFGSCGCSAVCID